MFYTFLSKLFLFQRLFSFQRCISIIHKTLRNFFENSFKILFHSISRKMQNFYILKMQIFLPQEMLFCVSNAPFNDNLNSAEMKKATSNLKCNIFFTQKNSLCKKNLIYFSVMYYSVANSSVQKQ